MKEQFNSAEELMEHLKRQIIQYPEEGDTIDMSQAGYKYSNHNKIDLSNFFAERESNNMLWSVSADRPITSHRKLTGKFIVFGKKVVRKLLRWYVSKTFELQTTFNGSVTRSVNELSNVLIQLTAKLEEHEVSLKEQRKYIEELEHKLGTTVGSLKEQQNYIEALEHKVGTTDESLKEQQNYIEALEHKVGTTDESLKEQQNYIEALEHKIGTTVGNLKEQQNYIEALEHKVGTTNEKFVLTLNQINSRIDGVGEQFAAEMNFMQYRMRQIKKNTIENSQQLRETAVTNENIISSEQVDSNSFDYLHFENKFRGSIEEIKNRQKVYLPYFANKQNILDIGCGRGEFIELLIESNISVKGIDLNQEMVEYCQDRGLPVEYNDAINYLHTVENNQLGGIFLGQVIEHMTFEQIIELVELAFSKLTPGSHLIMETPNPLSLAIFYRTFYVDPTHVKPVHPLTIQYLVESVGFSKTELVYSSRIEPNWWLPQLQAADNAINNIDEFNQGINRINDLLYGNLDYAIIAKK